MMWFILGLPLALAVFAAIICCGYLLCRVEADVYVPSRDEQVMTVEIPKRGIDGETFARPGFAGWLDRWRVEGHGLMSAFLWDARMLIALTLNLLPGYCWTHLVSWIHGERKLSTCREACPDPRCCRKASR